MMEIICNLPKTKAEIIKFCKELIQELIKGEFKKLKSRHYFVRWATFKKDDPAIAAVFDSQTSLDDGRISMFVTLGGPFFNIMLNSHHAKEMGRWPKNKFLALLRHELLHVLTGRDDGDSIFKKGLERKNLSISGMPLLTEEEKKREFRQDLEKVKKTFIREHIKRGES